LNKNKLLISLLKMMLLVLVAITAFEYAKYMIFPGLTVFYSHIIGITAGIMIVGVTAYRVQKKQEKLLIEKIDENERRMQSEASLRDVEERYRKLFIDSMDGVCRTTLDGRIVEANQAFCDILGCDTDKIIGESITQFYDNPQDRVKFRGVVEKNKGVKNYEIIQKRIDGRQIICSVSSSYCYSQQGEMDGYLTIVRDVTENKKGEEALQESEERYRSLVELSPEAVVVHSEGKIAYINKSGIKIFGASNPAEMVGKSIKDFVHPDYWGRVNQRVKRVQENSEPALPQELVFKKLSGEAITVETAGVPITLSGNIASLTIIHDITERKQAEEKERRNREEAERLAGEMAVIAEIGKVVGSSLDVDEVYEQFAAETKKLIRIDSLTVNLYNVQENTLRVAYVSGFNIDSRKKGEPLVLKGSLSEAVIRARIGLLIQPENIEETVRQFPRLSTIFQVGLRSIMCVPLISRGEVIGVLHFRAKKQNAYTEQDLRLAERIGIQIAGAIANAELFANLRKADKALFETESRFRGLVEQAAVGVAEIDMNTGRFYTVNRRLCELMGRTEEEMLATTFLAITHPEDLHLHEEKTRMMMAGQIGHYTLEKRYLRKDGESVWVNITVSPLWKPGETPGRNIAVVEDITDRKRMEAEILSLSITDQLTGLHNRRGFVSLVGQQLKLAERNKSGMLLFFADLDGLKWINDTLGHEEGDRALVEAATVLKETFRASDIVARLGGDEYAALAVDITDADSMIFTARLQSLIDTRNSQGNRRYRLSVSVGCSCYDPENPCSLDELMASADKLMYEQKQKKKGLLPQGASLSNSIH
jgi:diguanylate cyclase (GGDEF)-like protein/PAS domain S-box-containing protein